MFRRFGQEQRPIYSLIVPVRHPPGRFREHVEYACYLLVKIGLVPFEVILVPDAREADRTDPSRAWCEELAERLAGVRAVSHSGPPGTGAALRTGVRIAQGKYVLITDADFSYGLEFFAQAVHLLEEGVSLVVGNRRSPESWFEVPVPWLRYVYGRHRLSLAFNRLVRRLLPIDREDPLVGIKAMTRELARVAFLRDLCPGLLFPLEVFLIAQSRGMAVADLPVRFTQYEDVTTAGFLRLSAHALLWLARIKVRHLLGRYRDLPPLPSGREAPLHLH